MSDIKAVVDVSEIKKWPEKAAQLNSILNLLFEKVIEEVYVESQRLVPVATGALKKSGKIVRRVTNGENLPEVAIDYGNDVVNYAIIVHEDLQAHHAEGTQAKFVEVPFVRYTEHLQELVAQRMEQLLKPGGS